MALHDLSADIPDVPGYVLSERLGAGASGAVWAATRQADRAQVAVKVVPVATTEQADAAAREFAVLARVDVEGLVTFHEAIGLSGEPAAVALVLDRVGGGSLEQVVGARGHLSVGESVTILAPVARALAGLHALGVVHGDVTPGNVLVERTGRPLLADLGVAALAGEVPGDLYGTPGFVAPEVIDRGVVTAASDVYAVGALAWWCVSGAPPEPMALRRPLSELAPGLPQDWHDATMRALSGDPLDRPSAAELALAYFDSAPCEPLRLVVGGDETSLLTQRLRQAAVPPATEEPAAPQGIGRLTELPARVAGLVANRLRDIGRGSRRSARRWRAPQRRTVTALATAALVVSGLLCGALMAGGQLPTPTWISSSHGSTSAGQDPDDGAVPVSQHSATTSTPSRTSRSPGARTDPATDHRAPETNPRGLMQALSDIRADAMNSGSAQQLAVLDAPDSAALAMDTAALARLRTSGESYDGVRLTVRQASRAVSTKERATTDTAVVDAVVDTAAYRVVGKSGTAHPQAAVAGEELRFELHWVRGRWRVASITAAD
jgi:eukaryotic-like serine/threonine-protein kinase